MNEIISIIAAQDNLRKKTALASVVHVDGSSYRRPGARMLITEDGELFGSISGGCLEGDALKKALLAIHSNKSMLVTYDTSDEDDAKLGLGMGCNGVIQVLIEPIDISNANNPVNLLRMATENRKSSVIVSLFSLANKRAFQPGTCLVLKDDCIIGNAPVFNEVIMGDAKLALKNGETSFKNYKSENNNYTAFIEYIAPPISLIVIGAGNDVIPLIKMAEILGWQTTVIDGRAAYGKQERFTPTCRVLVSKPDNVVNKLVIDEQTVILLMTHNYNYDLAILRSLLTTDVVYIGSLGPLSKLDRMLNELLTEGLIISDEQRARIYGPVGLNIGAETPEEIALSILAEIKAVLSGKKVISLRDSEVIHSRTKTRIEEIHIKN